MKIKAFGITREIVGTREMELTLSGGTVGALRQQLISSYPRLKDLNSLMIAVNNEYADDLIQLAEEDEIALIPPVSGG